jgi:predicted metal-dependent hydrolase
MTDPWEPPIRVISSARRTRTISARMVGGTLELRVPASMSEAERGRWVERMRERLRRQVRRTRNDVDLEERAKRLNQRHFHGALRWNGVAWAEQQSRWGSCSPAAGGIRISSRAAELPPWVLDYILVHELAHLREPGHGPEFWALCNRYSLTERARGYLMAVDHIRGMEELTG